MSTGVYREYPQQPLPPPRAALFPAGSGSAAPSRGPSVAMTAWWPDYPAQVLAVGTAALMTPPAPLYTPPGNPPNPAAFQRPELAYPSQEPLIEAVAPLVFVPAPIYQPTGIPSQPAAFQRPDLSYPNQGPLLEDTAVIDDTVVVVVPDAVPNQAQAYDRTPWPWPPVPITPTFATLAPPPGSPYLLPPAHIQQLAPPDYPTQVLPVPLAAVIPLPSSAYVFTGLSFTQAAYQRPELAYPSQEPFVEPVAPFQTFAGPVYVFQGLPPQPAVYQERIWSWPPVPTYLAALGPVPAATVAPRPLAMPWIVDYPNQSPLTPPAAAVQTPADPIYVFTGIPSQPAALQRYELAYPNQSPLTPPAAAIGTLPPGASFVYPSPPPAVTSGWRPDAPIVLSLGGGLAGLMASPDPTPLFTGIPMVPATYQRPELVYPNQAPISSASAVADAQIKQGYVPVLIVVRFDLRDPPAIQPAPPLAAQFDALTKQGYVPPKALLGQPDRIEPPPLQPPPPMGAFQDSQIKAAWVPPAPVVRYDRMPEPLIQPMRLFTVIYWVPPVQLQPGETISFGIPDDRLISITVDDRRIYPVPFR